MVTTSESSEVMSVGREMATMTRAARCVRGVGNGGSCLDSFSIH